MKLGDEILSNAYNLLNVPGLTGAISGKIVKGLVSPKSRVEDVEINLLTNQNGYLQDGFINVNVYAKTSEHNRHIQRLDEILKIVAPLIDGKKIGNNAFQIEGQSGYIPDDIRDTMSFVNLKIKFQII